MRKALPYKTSPQQNLMGGKEDPLQVPLVNLKLTLVIDAG
jgi:hypothetical protein